MILNDGVLEFKLQGKEKVIDASIDLLILELACNELLQSKPLGIFKEGDKAVEKDPTLIGRYVSTAEFTFALSKKLQPFVTYSEPHQLTPSQAHELWAKSGEMVADVKKNTKPTPSSPPPTDSLPSDSLANSAPGCC
jgi:hypothetical protein